MKLFKELGKKLGLQLSPNEREELDAIDEEIRNLPLNVGFIALNIFQELLQYRREDTAEAYILIHAMQEALNIAQSSNGNQTQWLETLYLAQEADKRIQPLIEAKFQNLVSPHYGIYFNIMCYGSTIGIIVLPHLCRAINMTPEENATMISIYTILLFMPAFIGYFLDFFRSEFTYYLSSTMTEHVLDAAEKANVTLDFAHIPTNRPIDKCSNAQILEKIGVSDVPEHFLCLISYQIMDNPTFSRQHHARFDKKSIYDWLNKRNIHPVEQGPLYRENLILDGELKKRIDHYVDKEKQTFIKTKKYIDLFVLQPLIEQSLFSQKSSIEDEDISDEMMLHSAFGQGSNTYKAKRG